MRRLIASPALRVGLPLLALALALLIVPLPGTATPAAREITIDARQFEFAPGRIHVNQGDRVTLILTASDVVHGFYLDGYDLEAQIEPGVAQRIEFVAERPGKFHYRCAVSCGPLHPFMIGELVVGQNSPFWRAAGLIALAALGMLVYLWQAGKTNPLQEFSYG